ncbi:hypothetical protein RCL_jg1530.t1 [Rhizophagus clarus]|uniref:Uncharacterized protein n=1 Tax=Rhizophagus clarus TaxID=94130 RepID=A0A8H3L7A1_9GLOM|nr:hypothetical protein RCL_jg1530.t1 [Rhizophagus clarus]
MYSLFGERIEKGFVLVGEHTINLWCVGMQLFASSPTNHAGDGKGFVLVARFRPAHILDVTKIPGNRVYHYEEITNKFERRLEDSLESRQKIKVKITNASTGDQIAPNSQSLEPVETVNQSAQI